MYKATETAQPVAQPVQGDQIADFLGSFFSSPEKIFSALVKTLIGFLLVSITMVIVIDKKQ